MLALRTVTYCTENEETPAHYLKLPAGADLAGLPIGGILEAKPPAQERAVDRSILAAARDGICTAASHQAQLAQASDRDPQATS